MADAKLSKDVQEKGWAVRHAQEDQVVQSGGFGKNEASALVVKHGSFVADKRVGTALYELQGDSVEQLQERIEEYEAGQPKPVEEQNKMSPEEKLESAKATLHLAVSAGARPGATVDLTDDAEVPEPKSTTLSASPTIVELDEKSDAQPVIEDAPKGK